MKLKDYKKSKFNIQQKIKSLNIQINYIINIVILCQISIKTPLNHNMDLIMVQILDNIIKNKITRKIKVLNINFNPNQKYFYKLFNNLFSKYNTGF